MSQPLVRADNPYSIFRLPEALTCWPAVSVMAASFLVAALVFALGRVENQRELITPAAR